MTKLTLGTAKITRFKHDFLVTYMPNGNFSIGEQTFLHEADACEFCRERKLRVIHRDYPMDDE